MCGLVKSNVNVDTCRTEIEAKYLETACGLVATRSMLYEWGLCRLQTLEFVRLHYKGHVINK